MVRASSHTHPNPPSSPAHQQLHGAHLEDEVMLQLACELQLPLVLPAVGPPPVPPGTLGAKTKVPHPGLAPVWDQEFMGGATNLTDQPSALGTTHKPCKLYTTHDAPMYAT